MAPAGSAAASPLRASASLHSQPNGGRPASQDCCSPIRARSMTAPGLQVRQCLQHGSMLSSQHPPQLLHTLLALSQLPRARLQRRLPAWDGLCITLAPLRRCLAPPCGKLNWELGAVCAPSLQLSCRLLESSPGLLGTLHCPACLCQPAWCEDKSFAYCPVLHMSDLVTCT